MQINKDANGYTFLFSIAIVIVVGVVLSSLTLALGPRKKFNVEVKKKMDILSAIGVETTRADGVEKYDLYIKDAYVISADGVLQENLPTDKQAFNLDVLKQSRDKTIAEKDRLYPIFEAEVDGETQYVLPVVGKGLWGPIWGYVAIASDYETITGVSFDHSGETPGLGAEISQPFFTERYIGEKIGENGNSLDIMVVKDGTGTGVNQKVDGITGGTITSKGVERMVNETMRVYYNYFSKLN